MFWHCQPTQPTMGCELNGLGSPKIKKIKNKKRISNDFIQNLLLFRFMVKKQINNITSLQKKGTQVYKNHSMFNLKTDALISGPVGYQCRIYSR